jgi:hypothetical protein
MNESQLSSEQLNTGFTAMSNVPAFKSANEFSMHIEQMAADKRLTHLEAVLLFCEQHLLEPSDIASKITKSLKAKIEHDFRELNYLPKQAQLDV